MNKPRNEKQVRKAIEELGKRFKDYEIQKGNSKVTYEQALNEARKVAERVEGNRK